MSNSTAINIVLNPVIDIAKFNQLVNTMKSAFVDLNPIDGKKLTASLSSIKPSFVGLNTEAKGLADEISKAANNTKGLGDNATLASKAFDFNNMINAVSNITSAFSQITQVGIDFEDSLAAVSAITGFTGEKLDVLGVSARNLAKEFGGSATDQLTSFQGILSKLGPEMANDSEALATYAKNVNILSKASGDDAATSMSALTDSLLQMGLASGTPAQIANESTKAINILAASAQVGAAEIPQVAQALLASGVAAKGANMSLVDVNAAIQVLAVGGKTGAEAGTALRNVLGLMQKASGPAEAAMAKLGTSSKELGKILTTQGLDVALAKLNEGMNKVGTDAERNAIMMEIFGTENSAAAGIMLQNTDKFAAFSKGIEAGMQGQGAAFEQAGIRMNTAGEMINKVQAYVSDAFIGITQSIGQGATALIGASAQFAPLITSFAGLSTLIPTGMFDNAIGSMKSLGATIISSVVPGLVTQDIATKSIVFNTNALTVANIKNAIASKAKLALDYLQTTAIYGLVTGQMSLNAAMLANPIGAVIAGAVALGGVFYLLYDNVESVRNIFDGAWSTIVGGAKTAWAAITSFGSAVSSVMDFAGTGLKQLLSLDFGGLLDTVTGAASKASDTFNDSFNSKMRANNFDDAKKAIEEGLTKAGDVQIKVNAKANFEDILSKYEATKKRMDELSAKKSSGTIGVQEAKELENLKQKAQEYSQSIQKIAPQTVNSMTGIVDANGKLSTYYDINISKAKEFGKATDYSSSLSQQKQAVSKNLTDMGKTYDEQMKYVEKIQSQMQKGIGDSKVYDEMSKSFTEATAKAEEMRTTLVDNFIKAGEAGMITDDAIKGVAKSLKTTEQEAKKMLLVAELKKLKDSGLETEEAIARIGNKYGYSKEQAKLLANESSNQTQNVKETEVAVKNLADAWDSVASAIKGSSDSSIKNYASGAAYLKLLKKNPEEAKKMYAAATDEAKKMFDKLSTMANNGDEADNWLKAERQKSIEAQKTNAIITEAYDASVKEVSTKKDSTKETKKATAEAKSQYEILKDNLAIEEQKLQSQHNNNILLRDETRLKAGLMVTNRQSNMDKLGELDLEKTVLELKRKNTLALIGQVSEGIKDKQKQVEETKRLNEELDKTNQAIRKIGNDKLQITATLGLDDSKLREEIVQIESDAQRIKLEADIKLGKINSSELDLFDLNKLSADKNKFIKEIEEIQTKISNNKASSLDFSELEKELATKQSLITKTDIDIYAKQRELDDKRSRERIDSMANGVEREHSLRLYELKRTFDEEQALNKDNTAKLLVIRAAYNDAVNKEEQSYLAKTSFAFNAVTKLSAAFMNMKPPAFDNSKIYDLNKTKTELAKERQSIMDSYSSGKADYETYQNSLSEIQQKESDNRIAIESAEAEKRKQIWSGFTTAVSGYFGVMRDEYTQKTDESIRKVLSGTGDTDKAIKEMYANLAISAGATFGQLIADNDNFGKAFLKTALGTLKSLVPIISAQILGYSLATPDAVLTLGTTAILKHAALTALLYGAVGLAESAVSGAFKDGVVNFQGKGNGTSDSNLVKISHGESVMTAKATANPINKKFFSHANKGGDLVSFLQTDKDIQRQLAQQRIMQSYESVSRQKEMFDRIVADYNNTNKQLKEQNRELQKNQIALLSKLDEINLTLKTTKIINSQHNYKVDVNNNVVGALQSTDIFRS